MARAAHANCTRAKEYPDGYGLLLLLLFMTGSGSGHIFIHDNRDGTTGKGKHSLWIIGLLFAAPGVDASIPLFYSFLSFRTFSFCWDWHLPTTRSDGLMIMDDF